MSRLEGFMSVCVFIMNPVLLTNSRSKVTAPIGWPILDLVTKSCEL